jgi:hypothetical protein
MGLYLISEMVVHLWVDQPLNYYEPELAMDAYRLSQGQSIYPPFETGPFAGLYAPLYQLVTSLFFVIGWQELATLRLISIGSILTAAWLMSRMSIGPFSNTKITHFAWAALLLLVWHNDVVQFDMHGKPDAFGALWMVVGIYFLHRAYRHNFAHWLLALAMGAFTLALATKQTMLFALPPVLLSIWIWGSFRTAISALGYFVLFNLMLWPLLWWITGPNMWFYVFEQAGIFPYRWGSLFNNAYNLLTQPLMLLAAGLLLWNYYQHKWNFILGLLSLLLLFAIPAGVITAIKAGGMSNAHLPTFWIASLIVYTTIPWKNWPNQTSSDDNGENSNGAGRFAIVGLAVILFLQLGIQPYVWLTSFDYRLTGHEEYNKLAESLRSVEGSIFSPWDNYLTLKAGNPLVWSIKWERETKLHDIESDYSSDYWAENSEAVVTVSVSGSSQSHMPEVLENARFQKAESFAISQSLTYHLWKAPAKNLNTAN